MHNYRVDIYIAIYLQVVYDRFNDHGYVYVVMYLTQFPIQLYIVYNIAHDCYMVHRLHHIAI